MKDVSFVIPFRDNGDPRRNRNLMWNKQRIQLFFPESELIESDSDGEQFNLSQARNNGIKRATRKYVANLDADVVWNRKVMEEARQALEDGAPWMIPFHSFRALTVGSSDQVMGSGHATYINSHDLQYDYIKDATNDEIYPTVSGLTVLRRDDLYKIGGFDEDFIGWGWEDREFVVTADRTLGSHVRLSHEIYHLWHERGDADTHQPRYHDNWRLYDETVANTRERKKFL